MSSIPEEIYVDILSRIPVKSLLTCKCVCKNWYALISRSDFVKLHLNLTMQKNKPNLVLRHDSNLIYSIPNTSLASASWVTEFYDHAVEMDYPFKSFGSSVELLGSCNGLVCLRNIEMGFFCFWNPATKEYVKIPKSPNHVSEDYNYFDHVYAFGYDYKIDDYKLIRIASLDGSNYGSSVEVYSLRANSWRNNQILPYRFSFNPQTKMFVNGVLHWLVKNQEDAALIVSLDISNERFIEIQLPENSLCILSLGVLEGCLCLLVDYYDVRVEVWVLQDYGVRESWTKRYIINNKHIVSHCYLLRLVWSFKSGEILFEVAGNLIIYDSRFGSATYPKIDTKAVNTREEKYFETLVSLNSGTFMGRERIVDLNEDEAYGENEG